MRSFNFMMIAGIMAVCVLINLRCLMKLDKDHGMVISVKEWCLLTAGSLITAGIWLILNGGEDGTAKTAWFIIYIYFLSCTMTDSMTCQVYDIFQYPGVAAAGFLVIRGQCGIEVGISLVLFAVLQYVIFMRLYGEADGMAFLIAALAQGALGYDINMYLFHMITAYLMLALVQICRGNIAVKGRLKKAVAFVPYITVSFWIILIFGEQISNYI